MEFKSQDESGAGYDQVDMVRRIYKVE